MFWTIYAALYDLLWDNELTEEVAVAVVDRIDAGDSVIEVGAGTGLVTRALVDAQAGLLATEPEPAMRRRAQARLPGTKIAAERIQDLDLLCGFEYPEVVVAVNVVHLTPDPGESIAALRRLAGHGGRVIVVTPVPDMTMRRVLSGLRKAGVPVQRRLRFLFLHGLLAPLTGLAGMGIDPERLAAVPTRHAVEESQICGVSRLLVYPGVGD